LCYLIDNTSLLISGLVCSNYMSILQHFKILLFQRSQLQLVIMRGSEQSATVYIICHIWFI